MNDQVVFEVEGFHGNIHYSDSIFVNDGDTEEDLRRRAMERVMEEIHIYISDEELRDAGIKTEDEEEEKTPSVTCPTCGYTYNLTPEYIRDNWNLGHYGCTEGDIVKITWKDNGCPECLRRSYEEERRRKEEIKDALKFYRVNKDKTDKKVINGRTYKKRKKRDHTLIRNFAGIKPTPWDPKEVADALRYRDKEKRK